MKSRFPQMTGLEWPMPGIATFQRTFFPSSTFHVAGAAAPSATPLASAPRKEGQFTVTRGGAFLGAEAPIDATASKSKTLHRKRTVIVSPLQRAPRGTGGLGNAKCKMQN